MVNSYSRNYVAPHVLVLFMVIPKPMCVMLVIVLVVSVLVLQILSARNVIRIGITMLILILVMLLDCVPLDLFTTRLTDKFVKNVFSLHTFVRLVLHLEPVLPAFYLDIWNRPLVERVVRLVNMQMMLVLNVRLVIIIVLFVRVLLLHSVHNVKLMLLFIIWLEELLVKQIALRDIINLSREQLDQDFVLYAEIIVLHVILHCLLLVIRV